MKKTTIEGVKEIVSVLSADEQQLLKDTIIYGFWGDTEEDMLNEQGNQEYVWTYGYCTNDAVNGGHFTGRERSAMFKSIYSKLCPMRVSQYRAMGEYISHCTDWWGDGSGDMLFIRCEYEEAFRAWAKQ